MNSTKIALDELQTLTPRRKFYTKEALQSAEHAMKLKVYESIMRANAAHPYRYFATITFSDPIVDAIAVCTTNLHVKRFIKRKLYNRRASKCNLNFAFFIEPHILQHRNQNRLHVHFLMTPCEQSLLHLDALTDETLQLLKLTSYLKQVLSRVYYFDNRICAQITGLHIKHVTEKEPLIDYLMKQLRRDSSLDVMSMIDINNSDLAF